MEPSWAVLIALLIALLGVASVAVVAGVVVGVVVARRGGGDPVGDEAGARSPFARRPALPEGVGEVLDVLRSASVVLDPAGTVVRGSPPAYAFGLVRDGHLVHPELRELAAEGRALGAVRQRELELPRGPLGKGRLVLLARVAPIADGLTLLLVEDRTEARRLEEVRRDFVGNVSHELKTPIGALSLLAEAVHDAADEPAAVRHFADRMQRESRRLTTLVQEIIDLTRVQVADTLSEPVLVQVDDVVADAVDRCRLAAATRRIEVVTGGEEGAMVYGDHQLLVTAVRNLVDNAISYSPEGTRVRVVVRRADTLVEIAVTDEGIGIPAAEQDRIFERFYRVDPARSRATGGTGLGLSIVKHVVANHGGECTVWSMPGQGSTFTLRLPESAHAAPPTGAGPGTTPGAGPAPHDEPRRGSNPQPAPGPVAESEGARP